MMKKFICLTTLLLALTSVNVNAADSFWNHLHLECAGGFGPKSNSVKPIDGSCKVSVTVTSMVHVLISLEENLALYNNAAKTYYSGTGLGGGLGVTLFGAKEKSSSALDLRGQVLASLGNADWKRTTYELALACYLKSGRQLSPLIELGYRYIDSRSLLNDYGNVYLRLGIRF